MKKYSLGKNGLSMTQAQTLSNLCFQRQSDINKELEQISCVRRSIQINGNREPYEISVGLPSNIVDILKTKAEYAAMQAFLMENIKAKDNLLKQEDEKLRSFRYDVSERPFWDDYEPEELTLSPLVGEEYGWEQLSAEEYNDYLYNQSMAAHIGQFIHSNGKLDTLRKEVSNTNLIEWIELKKDEKTPIFLEYTTSSDALSKLHLELSNLHREYEQKVNFYKAKVKNIVSDRNQEITIANKTKSDEYELLLTEARKKYNQDTDDYNLAMKKTYNELQQEVIKNKRKISEYKIKIPENLTKILNELLK